MRACTTTTAFVVGILALGLAASAQQPRPDGAADRSPPSADAPGRRGRARSDDAGPPQPAAAPKSPQRARSGSPDQPNFMPPPGAFGGGFGEGGYGGFSGMRGGYGRGWAPQGLGGPGLLGEPPADDPEMQDLMKQDANLDRQAHEMAAQMREVRGAYGEDRTKLKAQLADLVKKHFDVRQKRRELQLKRMEDELKRLREAIAKRDDSRDSIIENRVKELVGEPRDLDF
jgi:hypothetical protein